MPVAPRETVLCRYHYDPLDRLVDCAPSAEAGIQRFYCKSRLATEIQGAVQRSVFQHDDQLLAQRRREDAKVKTALLATDQQRSVLNVLDANRVHPLAYSPYGHRPAESGLLSLLGFNGERPDPVTGHYLLGNGYRAFNPVLMRFNSPDSLSPFSEGGLNTYTYCTGNPANNIDPSGHSLISTISTVKNWIVGGLKYTSAKAIKHAPVYGTKIKKVLSYENPIPHSDFEIFNDFAKGGPRLNIVGHGSKQDSGIFSNDRFRSHHDINDLLHFSGVDYAEYKSIRILSCYSAENGLAQNIANISGLPTKGYRGPVSAAFDGTGTNRESLVIKGGLLHFLIPILPRYDSVTFYPIKPRTGLITAQENIIHRVRAP
jgi:RHS repeat-associated protein